MSDRNYKRAFLRAPHRFHVIHNSPQGVLVTQSLYISESSVVLDNVESFHEGRELNNLLIPIAKFPIFKEYEIEKLVNFDLQTIPKKIIRAKGKVARKISTKVESELPVSKMAIEFTQIEDEAKKEIDEYTQVFIKNLTYLLSLFDMIDSDPSNKEKVQIMAKILGYDANDSLAALKTQIQHDFRSLQWN